MRKYLLVNEGKNILNWHNLSQICAQCIQSLTERSNQVTLIRHPCCLPSPYSDSIQLFATAQSFHRTFLFNLLTKIIAREFNYETALEFDITHSDGQFKKTADNSKLINLIGDYNFTSINKGIKNSVEWFIHNYKACRKS